MCPFAEPKNTPILSLTHTFQMHQNLKFMSKTPRFPSGFQLMSFIQRPDSVVIFFFLSLFHLSTFIAFLFHKKCTKYRFLCIWACVLYMHWWCCFWWRITMIQNAGAKLFIAISAWRYEATEKCWMTKKGVNCEKQKVECKIHILKSGNNSFFNRFPTNFHFTEIYSLEYLYFLHRSSFIAEPNQAKPNHVLKCIGQIFSASSKRKWKMFQRKCFSRPNNFGVPLEAERFERRPQNDFNWIELQFWNKSF